MSKYHPLNTHLGALPPGTSRVTLKFSDIVALGCNLPPAAYRHNAWWSNTESGHSQTAGWLPTWRTVGADLSRQEVTFVRQPQGDDDTASRNPIAPKSGLTLGEVKAGIAAALGVPPTSIEITIRG